jgi:hypothetical protein
MESLPTITDLLIVLSKYPQQSKEDEKDSHLPTEYERIMQGLR